MIVSNYNSRTFSYVKEDLNYFEVLYDLYGRRIVHRLKTQMTYEEICKYFSNLSLTNLKVYRVNSLRVLYTGKYRRF